MTLLARLGLLLMVVSAFAACTLPRGAALQSEITRNATAENPTFKVIEVTRDAVHDIKDWPATGWQGHYHWFAAERAPASRLIRTGDMIGLRIWDNQDNSLLTSDLERTVAMNGLEVSPSGTIFVPYIDEVQVRGMTPEAARVLVQERMEVVAPSVQVQLTAEPGLQNSVDLVSGVPSPGTYPLPSRDYTILSLLARGGGVANTLRNPIVRLIRDGQTYGIRAKDLFSDASRNVTVRGGDKVIVEEDDRFFVGLGATGREELIYFDREDVTALESMSMLGGLSDGRANPQGVLVLREYPASALRVDGSGPSMRQVVFTFDLTSADGLFAARQFRIYPEDTVMATESPVTSTFTILGLFGTALGIGNQLGPR